MKNTVTVPDVVGLRVTEGGALIVEVCGDEYAIPIAMIHEDSDVRGEGDEGDLMIPEHLAVDKGLDDFVE